MVQSIYLDACSKCPAEVSDLRDLVTIQSRVEAEGVSFLTITLPNFAKDFERSLAIGYIDSTLFRSFRKCGAIPAFLRGMLSRIFDHETGRILDDSSDTPILVGAIRQVCLFFKKVELPCTPERDRAAVENFLQVEHLNKEFAVPSDDYDFFCKTSDMLWGNMLGDIRLDMLFPRHGPGTTAEGILGNSKYSWRTWYERLEPFFGFLGTAYSVSSFESEEFEKVTFVPVQDELPVKVTLVPKTLKGPRIIAIEPVCMQYTQQAVQSYLYDTIETYWLTKGHVNFTDQSVNQLLALISSSTGQYATIDLSDASDRVLHGLAMEMFRCNRDLSDAIESCRSTKAVLPDGRIISPLYKFASMGSALCFPVESMYFYTICIVASLRWHNLPVTLENIFNVSRGVYVYGDDLIVPQDVAGTVLDHLRKYNCKVNDAKTFYTGKFRESCGVDAYDGIDVTPQYLRRLRPENRQQARRLLSWIATANLLYLKGYFRTASFMYCICERILGPLPQVSPRSPALGRISPSDFIPPKRWNEGTQEFERVHWVPSIVYRSDEIDGYPALTKCLLSLERGRGSQLDGILPVAMAFGDWEYWKRGFVPLVSDIHHLERTALRGEVSLKRRWVSANI
jgi:hypothetical protein